MRITVIALLLASLLLPAAHAATQGKISLDVQNMPLRDAIAQIAQQSQASIALDPKAEGSVTVSLTGVDLSQALDIITKMNKLTWKKVSFALPEGDSAKLDQLKSAILALAAIPVTGLVVDDPATKQSAVVARNLSASPETTAMKLPEGYAWKTFYIVTPPIVAASKSASASKSQLAELSQQQVQTLQTLAAMTPEERRQYYANEATAEMTLSPEDRQALIRDQARAIKSLDPQMRNQMKQDKHAAFGHRGGGAGGYKPSKNTR